MKLFYYIIIIIFASPLHNNFLFAQNKKNLSIETLKIKKAFAELKKDSTYSKQILFIESFPQDWNTFLKVFHPENFGELYDSSYYYLNKLYELASVNSDKVGELLIKLAKDAEWDADAPGYLQSILADYAAKNTKKFVSLLSHEKNNNIHHIIVFLADVENHNYYENYQLIIDNLIKLNELKLAKKFEKARENRINQIDH